MIAWWLVACLVRVPIETSPIAGEVRWEGERLRTPAEVPVRWVPWRRATVVVAAPGYRVVRVPLRLGWGPLSPRRVAPVRVLLVPDHGPAGTWTPEDVP